MTTKTKYHPDAVSWRLLEVLQANGRASFAELARAVGMSVPAVSERVRRLEEAGVIRGYHAELDPACIGLPVTVFIHLKTPASQYDRFLTMARATAEIRECHHITGEDAFIIRAVVASIGRLEEFIRQLSPFGTTRTSIVMSTPVLKRVYGAPAGER